MLHSFKDKHPVIAPDAFIEESAQIIGDVVIGALSSVWFGTVIRGDVNHIRIGERTSVQDLSMLHVQKDEWPLILGDDITIGHAVKLHGCRIQDRCLVGIGAIVLNGAVVEPDCIVAAGALVTQGTVIPSGSLAMGAPARVKRALTDEERARIRKAADNYVGYSREYLAARARQK